MSEGNNIQVSVSDLKEMIREALGAFKLLDKLGVRFFLDAKSKIEQVMTDIRIIKGVATVSQEAEVKRSVTGKKVLDVTITFDPTTMDKKEYIMTLGKMMKEIEGVEILRIRTFNDKLIRRKDGKIVF